MTALPRQALAAEALGSALLLATVVGSGIMATALAQGNMAIALLANALATGAMLYGLITALGPVSGAHFNPAVTLVFALRRAIAPRLAAGYVLAQAAGAVAGVILAHAMFGQALVQVSVHARSGLGQALSETVATFALVLTILGTARARPDAVPAAVALVIVAAYWFTASTAFANPAVTLARALTDSFAGIAPADTPAFIAAQLMGAALALVTAEKVLGWARGAPVQP